MRIQELTERIKALSPIGNSGYFASSVQEWQKQNPEAGEVDLHVYCLRLFIAEIEFQVTRTGTYGLIDYLIENPEVEEILRTEQVQVMLRSKVIPLNKFIPTASVIHTTKQMRGKT